MDASPNKTVYSLIPVLKGKNKSIAGAAGIGGLKITQMRGGVISICCIDKQHTGLPGTPGPINNPVENGQGLLIASLNFFHELISESHAEIEVGELGQVFLGINELQDIRVINTQYSHVGAPPLAALLDGLSGGVEHLHEAQRAGGNPLGRLYGGVLGAQPGELISGAATGLVYQGAITDSGEDSIHGIIHRQYEAGRQLANAGTRIHQAR